MADANRPAAPPDRRGSTPPELPPWAPIAGGVALGLGLLTIFYTVFFGSSKQRKSKQQYICTKKIVEAVKCFPICAPSEDDECEDSCD